MRPLLTVVGCGLLVFLLLGIRFSPNWLAFQDEFREVRALTSNSAQKAAIEKAILSGYGSTRGFYVLEQARDPGVVIDEPNHKIIRWRLLVPIVGRLLGLPNWAILGIAHAGCLFLVVALVALGRGGGTNPIQPIDEAICLGIIAGATAPFFASMGWLGYYDSWLALAFLGVAFARQRWVVWLACVLAPWIDERFVLGLPLALCTRWVVPDVPAASRWIWFRQQALVPLALGVGYSAIRLGLGGSGGSQTVEEYLNQFVFTDRVTVAQRLVGAWEGLRWGWVLIGAALLVRWRISAKQIRFETLLLGTGVLLTALAGLFTAQDMSRSMVLIITVVPFGWIVLRRSPWWSRFRVAPTLAALALLVPASHVIGKDSLPVDRYWSPSLPLMAAQNNLGAIYLTGEGVRQDSVEAAKWFRRAAEEGDAAAQYNLGTRYEQGDGVAKDAAEAVRWFRRAAEQGQAIAQSDLGAMYANGAGVPRDLVLAHAWFALAATKGQANASANLATIEKKMTADQIAEANRVSLELSRTLPRK